jgi:hypothetical protein
MVFPIVGSNDNVINVIARVAVRSIQIFRIVDGYMVCFKLCVKSE